MRTALLVLALAVAGCRHAPAKPPVKAQSVTIDLQPIQVFGTTNAK